jgi:cold shock CspA family protein
MAALAVNWFNDDMGFGLVAPDNVCEDLFAQTAKVNMTGIRLSKNELNVVVEAPKIPCSKEVIQIGKEREMNAVRKNDALIKMNFPSLAEWEDSPSLILDERGMIYDCSKAGELLFGYRQKDLIWQHVSRLLPELSEVQLVKNGLFNPKLSFLSRCGHSFNAKTKLDQIFFNYLHFVLLGCAGAYTIRVTLHPLLTR